MNVAVVLLLVCRKGLKRKQIPKNILVVGCDNYSRQIQMRGGGKLQREKIVEIRVDGFSYFLPSLCVNTTTGKSFGQERLLAPGKKSSNFGKLTGCPGDHRYTRNCAS